MKLIKEFDEFEDEQDDPVGRTFYYVCYNIGEVSVRAYKLYCMKLDESGRYNFSLNKKTCLFSLREEDMYIVTDINKIENRRRYFIDENNVDLFKKVYKMAFERFKSYEIEKIENKLKEFYDRLGRIEELDYNVFFERETKKTQNGF